MTEQELRELMKSLPNQYGKTPWDRRRLILRQKIVEGGDLDFLKWPVIQSTMFVGELDTLDKERDVVNQWLVDPPLDPLVGSPPVVAGGTTANAIRQLRHIVTLEQMADINVANLSRIVEFGGGYGIMAYLVHDLGFEGTYVIYDFPEFLLLQQYYLEKAGLAEADIQFCPDLSCLETRDYDLMIAMDSITEVEGFTERNEFWFGISADVYFVRYHASEENEQWLRTLMFMMDNYEWKTADDPIDDRTYRVGIRYED